MITLLSKAAKLCEELTTDGLIVEIKLIPDGIRIQVRAYKRNLPPSICNTIITWQTLDGVTVDIISSAIIRAIEAAQQ